MHLSPRTRARIPAQPGRSPFGAARLQAEPARSSNSLPIAGLPSPHSDDSGAPDSPAHGSASVPRAIPGGMCLSPARRLSVARSGPAVSHAEPADLRRFFPCSGRSIATHMTRAWHAARRGLAGPPPLATPRPMRGAALPPATAMRGEGPFAERRSLHRRHSLTVSRGHRAALFCLSVRRCRGCHR